MMNALRVQTMRRRKQRNASLDQGGLMEVVSMYELSD